MAKHEVNFLNIGHDMKDGDHIDVDVSSQPDCPPHRVRISLALGEDVTWWKGIVLYKKDNANSSQKVVELQDDQCPMTVEIDYHLLRTHNLILCKAKTWGLHKPIYWIKDAEYVLQPGNCYSFTWLKD